MKLLLSVSIIIFTATFSIGQVKIPQESQYAEVKQQIGFTEVEINYTRPNMKNRTIFGEMVPWRSVWRTGANANTKLSVSKDIFLEGNKLPKGKYGLYTIPEKDQWTVIINKDTTLWGHYGYDEKNDLLRFQVKPVLHDEEVETLTINFKNVNDKGAIIEIRWGNIEVPINLVIDSIAQDKEVLSNITETLNKPVDRDKSIVVAHDYLEAAVYYLNNNKDLDQALEWVDKAIEIHSVNYFYLYKSDILGELERYGEAIEASKEGLAIFIKGTNKEWIWRYEVQIQKWESKKKSG